MRTQKERRRKKPGVVRAKSRAHAVQTPVRPGRKARDARAAAANSIRARRLELGLTLEEAARACGVSLQTFQEWETKGNLQVNRLPAVAKALKTTPAELVPGRVKAQVKSGPRAAARRTSEPVA